MAIGPKSLIVQKYGGSSVGDIERIKNVAARVARFYRDGHQVVVVVSAMKGVTDNLISLRLFHGRGPAGYIPALPLKA